MKALIFGANGQDGSYLAEECRLRDIEVVGISRSGEWIHGDVADCEFVRSIINEQRPSLIFHLAANSTTRHDALFENHATISKGTLNILESVYKGGIQASVFIAGSGLQFRNSGIPISEETSFEADSAYGISRIHSVYAARYYRRLGVKTYVGFLFHHESPRRGPHHVSQIIARAATEIKKGVRDALEIGDLSVEKEWTFAGDVTSAMVTLVSQERVFEVAIGSGETHSIQEWAECCFSHVGLDWRDHVKEATGYKPEYPRLVSDPGRIHSLGWKPVVRFKQLAAMMVEAAE